MNVFIDMDGVLVNLNKALARMLGLDYPREQQLWHGWAMDQAGVDGDVFYKMLTSAPESLWSEAEPFPWTEKLVNNLDIHAPGWKVLTNTIESPAIWCGKARWIQRYPMIRHSQVTMTGGDKHDLLSPGDVLVDDRPVVTEAWRQRGGQAFDWVEYTEDCTEPAHLQIDMLMEFIIGARLRKNTR